MNRLNAKRIGVLAASLLFGLAVAGPVSFSNIPIINSAGQPVVQVVVGSTAKPSDGVVAANIAAVIGNLAFTSTPVTATVSGQSNVKCVVTTPSCTVTNQQVWLGESGVSAPSGTYGFTALIGSVLNRAIQLSAPANTKSLQGSGQYAYPESKAITNTPASSPYAASAYVPFSTAITASYNGGGISIPSFTTSSQDNILQISSANLPSLLSNSGTYGENEFLWLTGFPVFDQQSGVNNFALLNAGGAYQVTFAKPIPLLSNAANTLATIKILGSNWTILSGTYPSTALTASGTTNAIPGGSLLLASSLTPKQTVYVGHNVSSGAFTVQLADLGQPANGISPASVLVYYNGVLTNTSSILANSNVPFNVSGHVLHVAVGTTFAGLYAYQKWAQIQLYSNLFPLVNGQNYNTTVNKGWNVQLLWTNATTGTVANALQSIIFYNTSPVSLTPGQSFNYMQTPAVWKATLVGDTLGSANYDPMSFSLSQQGSVTYGNSASSGQGSVVAVGVNSFSNDIITAAAAGTVAYAGKVNATVVTEPAQELTVSSQIPNAFSPTAGPQTSTLTFDLSPYVMTPISVVNTLAGNPTSVNVIITGATGNFISATYPLIVNVKGNRQGSTVTASFSFTASGAANFQSESSVFFDNITNIGLSRAIPGLTITVNSVSANTANQMTMATLATQSPELLYQLANNNYLSTASGTANVVYNQQNGQATTTLALAASSANGVVGQSIQYYTVNMLEYPVPSSTSQTDFMAFGIRNSTGGIGVQPLFQMNYSLAGTKNNVTYISSNSQSLNVPVGFVTERGSKVASISQTSLTLNLAKAVDQLQIIVGPLSSNAVTVQNQVGPYGVGQATNLPNVTIAKVNATCSFTSTSCTLSGLDNLTAMPTVKNATTAVKLDTATTPIAVLDTDANAASTLVVVGSKFVNSVAAQIFAQNPSLDSSFNTGSVVMQAYGSNRILVAGYYANQTVTAGNQFIEALLSAAST